MKEVERIRKKELKYQRDTGFWSAGFMFTFGCAPTLVSDLSNIRFSNLFFKKRIKQTYGTSATAAIVTNKQTNKQIKVQCVARHRHVKVNHIFN